MKLQFILKYSFYFFLMLSVLLFVILSTNHLMEAKEPETLKVVDKKEENLVNTWEKVQHKSMPVSLYEDITIFSYKRNAQAILLNKITGKSELINFHLNKVKSLKNLSIKLHKCCKSLDPLKSASLMLITVFDTNLGKGIPIFNGWINSSNLSISSLEHPIYIIIPLDCFD